MNRIRRTGYRAVIAAVCLAAWAARADAVGVAGQVSDVVGNVQIEHAGAMTPAQEGATLAAGDSLVVGVGSHAHFKTADGAVFSLMSDTRFTVAQYQFDPGSGGARPAAAALYRVDHGVVRTTTGSIGKNSGDNYLMSTPDGDVRVHGTDYQVEVRDGLAVTVFRGLVTVSNDSGSVNVAAGQLTYTAGRKYPLHVNLVIDVQPGSWPPLTIRASAS